MNRLLMLRKQAGMTQQQLAELAGVSRQSVQQYETGTTPFVRQGLKVARALGVRPEEIWPIDDDRSAA